MRYTAELTPLQPFSGLAHDIVIRCIAAVQGDSGDRNERIEYALSRGLISQLEAASLRMPA